MPWRAYVDGVAWDIPRYAHSIVWPVMKDVWRFGLPTKLGDVGKCVGTRD